MLRATTVPVPVLQSIQVSYYRTYYCMVLLLPYVGSMTCCMWISLKIRTLPTSPPSLLENVKNIYFSSAVSSNNHTPLPACHHRITLVKKKTLLYYFIEKVIFADVCSNILAGPAAGLEIYTQNVSSEVLHTAIRF